MSSPAKHPSGKLTRVLDVKTSRRTQLIDITGAVEKVVMESGVPAGICHLFVPHTTAGVMINENDDPDVVRDIEAALERLAPRDGSYQHAEGNADSHIKSACVGVSENVYVEQGRLALGRWQGIFFCEFDGPRSRQIRLKIVPDPHE